MPSRIHPKTHSARNSTIPSTSLSVHFGMSEEGAVGAANPTATHTSPTPTSAQAATVRRLIVFQSFSIAFSIVATSPFTSSSMDVPKISLSSRRLCTSG